MSIDASLLAVVCRPACGSYVDVLARLRDVGQALDVRDGLRWFNRLYADMTGAVAERAASGTFGDPGFLESLDQVVGFAGRGILRPPLPA